MTLRVKNGIMHLNLLNIEYRRNFDMNPLLPLDQFVPDGEARQHADGRLYLYGSLDVPGDDSYCSCRYRVFSSTA
ncbi:MAG: hypothetical protein ACLSB9_04920 [Hydrogeniiclostridium mannosilyticum]